MRAKRTVLPSTVVAVVIAIAAGAGVGAASTGAPADPPGPGVPRAGPPAIARAWHGKTPREKADAYERYLAGAIAKFPAIPGNLGYQLMRLDGGPDGEQYTEFQVISYWTSLEAIHAYAGEDIRRTRDLPRDQEYLVGMEPNVRNYRLLVSALRP